MKPFQAAQYSRPAPRQYSNTPTNHKIPKAPHCSLRLVTDSPSRFVPLGIGKVSFRAGFPRHWWTGRCVTFTAGHTRVLGNATISLSLLFLPFAFSWIFLSFTVSLLFLWFRLLVTFISLFLRSAIFFSFCNSYLMCFLLLISYSLYISSLIFIMHICFSFR